FYTTAISRHLSEQLDLDAALASGISIYTGLIPEMQSCAENAVQKGLESLEKNYAALAKAPQKIEAGLVAIEPFSGKIRAWVGGRDYSVNQFDHVDLASRQIGSTVKSFLYLTALDSGLNNYKVATPVTILSDTPMEVRLVANKTWQPENYDHQYRGDVTLRYALEHSLNIPAAYVGQKVGPENLLRTLRLFRLGDDLQPVPALALGAADTDLLSLTSAYAALANGGVYVSPRIYISALDQEGHNVLNSEIFEERVADENAVFVLTNILQGVVERGTGNIARRLGFERAAAAKTGTSNDTRDAWFIGFTPNLAAGVWVGYDDNGKLGLTGGVAAGPIWTEFMKCSEPFYPAMDFIAPPGVVFVDLDRRSGDRVTRSCPSDEVVREVFVSGTEPSNRCRFYPESGSQEAPPTDLPDEPVHRRRKGFWEILFG
ncbi:MAG: hypothetical protein KDD42_09055, partial [Bdellovibrionales bacterium]|nr:hypothetical protein [Bdellovibrionales bacterium]